MFTYALEDFGLGGDTSGLNASQFLCTGQYLGHVLDKLDSDTVQKHMYIYLQILGSFTCCVYLSPPPLALIPKARKGHTIVMDNTHIHTFIILSIQ